MITKEKSEILRQDIVVFALESSVSLTREVCAILDVPIGKVLVSRFADGELSIELEEAVRGKDVYFIQSTDRPVNDRLMQLLLAVDACKRASAKTVNVIIPYFGYARQDRKAKPRQPISSKLAASIIERAGATRIITMDLHAVQIQGFFDIPADDVSTLPLIAKYLKSHPDLHGEEIVVVSPDHGGTVRARKLAEQLDTSIAIIDKRRPKPNVAVAMHILGDVKGKTAVIIDDMVDTAGTLQSGIKRLYEEGAKDVYAACAHGLLSGPAIDRLKEAGLREFICTNTIDQSEHKKLLENMHVLSVAPLIAASIEAIQFNESLSGSLRESVEILDPANLEAIQLEESAEISETTAS